MAYRKLLVDPCHAALAKSPYAGPLGGVIERDVTLFANTKEYGIYFMHPVFGVYSWESSFPTATGSLTFSQLVAPGRQAMRGVAGCFSATYVGAESARSGSVSCGVVPGSVVWNYLATANGGAGQVLSVGATLSKLAEVKRMPVDMCEVNWFPGNGDEEVTSVPDSSSAADQEFIKTKFADVNFTAVIVANTALNNIQFKVTAVVEALSVVTATNSTAWTVSTPTKPSFNWKDVLSSLSNRDSSWYVDAWKKVGSLAGGTVAAYGTMGLPGALGYLTSNMAGLAIRGVQSVLAG